MTTKHDLRRILRAARREHVAALPQSMQALVFHRPPQPLLELVPEGAAVGLYHASPFEAPAASYARFLFERGHELLLPRFAERTAPMEFARHTDPFDQADLEVGPFGVLQPAAEAERGVPQVVFVPLLGFSPTGDRLGQGGGHYDRWLAVHPDTVAVGLAWDCQQVEHIPTEAHDRRLDAIVTPTRIYGPFA